MPKYAKPSEAQAKKEKRSMTPWIIGAGVLFLVLIALAVFINNPTRSIASIEAPDVPVDWIDRSTMGDPNAPVTIQAWEDFICPACQQWTAQVEPRVIEELVKTGKARLEFRQFPLQMHAPGAAMSAMASECAADQGGFWPYHDRLFVEASSRGQAAATLERLVEYAKDQGLDDGEFLTCMNSQRYWDQVNASASEAVSTGLTSTPSIVVGGQLMADPFDFNAIVQAVEANTP
ncbi:MAG: DsbA family protein [Caldilineaceae bacterium]|nr:DsbA family protein [Caldilineaceae bacterium]